MKTGGLMSMPKDCIHLSLRVLGYKSEKDLWAAHCLETDLVGYGKTFKKALDDLMELTHMQISFALHKKEPSLVLHEAPVEIIKQYNELMRLTLQHYPKKHRAYSNKKIASLPLPMDDSGANTDFVRSQAI